jgi:hypothetical protein
MWEFIPLGYFRNLARPKMRSDSGSSSLLHWDHVVAGSLAYMHSC